MFKRKELKMSKDRLAVTAHGVCAIMDEQGFTFDEIKAHLSSATQPTVGYFYCDEIPVK